MLSPSANYGSVNVKDRARLRLNVGIYRFQSLTLGSDSYLEAVGGGSVTIIVDGKVVIKDRANFLGFIDSNPLQLSSSYVSTSSSDYAINIGSDLNQKNGNVPLSANIVAPNGAVFLSYRVKLNGSIAAQWFTVREDSVLRCNIVRSKKRSMTPMAPHHDGMTQKKSKAKKRSMKKALPKQGSKQQ
jgi:hypothetical protein